MKLGKSIFYFLCLVSFFYGCLTYDSMLLESSPVFWIFIPDCPLYVAFLLLLVLFRIRNELFRFVVSVGLMKYALWTLMIFMLYPDVYFSPGLSTNSYILFGGHLLMWLGAFVVVPKNPKIKIAGLALLWFLLNDYVDYWLGTMPPFPPDHLDFVVPASIVLSIGSVVVLYLFNSLREISLVDWARRNLDVKK